MWTGEFGQANLARYCSWKLHVMLLHEIVLYLGTSRKSTVKLPLFYFFIANCTETINTSNLSLKTQHIAPCSWHPPEAEVCMLATFILKLNCGRKQATFLHAIEHYTLSTHLLKILSL